MKRHVVHLVTRLDLGGAQQNTLYTVSHLDPARFEATLACGPGGLLDDEARRLSEAPGRPFRLRWFPELVRDVSPVDDARAFLQLAAWLRALAPDVVHTHSSKAGILGRLAARAAGVPVILHTYHGFGFHDRQRPAVKSFYAALVRLCVAASDWTLFVSEDNRRYGEAHGLARAGRHAILRSGVELARLPARLEDRGRKKAQLGCGMHKPLVVSVGNLKPQKNPEGFLRVAAACLEREPELRFLFVGDGELRTRIEAQVIARGLHGKVLFPGWRRDTAEILAAADVFALTSLWEGLPRALVEAMKTGLPCVCYATDGVKDLLRDGENGYLVAPEDETRMAERILELVRRPELARELGRGAAASIGPEFDIDAMVRAQESLYASLLAARRDSVYNPSSSEKGGG
ncbi:MAG: glycosyltransferase family 4 protein [Elusimicrobia bacterium]|nr:glycosyltransferase family 4 protein [Elusimicrobiota bacterium]